MKVLPKAVGARNYTQCDSMLVGNQCGAHTFPYIEVGNNSAQVEHEASTSKIGEDQIFYLKQRGISAEQAVSIGDEIMVVVTEIDRQGRVNLSRKAAMQRHLAKEPVPTG